jgi:methyl-accepting chemotaxis protein
MPDIESTATIVREIAASSSEQNSGAEQINIALQNLNTETQKNAATSEEMATNAEELSTLAVELGEILEYFKTKSNETHISKKDIFSGRKAERTDLRPTLSKHVTEQESIESF